jgi:hypothetical protein
MDGLYLYLIGVRRCVKRIIIDCPGDWSLKGGCPGSDN